MFGSREGLDEELHRRITSGSSSSHVLEDAVDTAVEVACVDTPRISAEAMQLLEASEDLIERRLKAGRVIAAVLGSGLMTDEDTYWYDKPVGTPYVLIGVDSWDASVDVERALKEVALTNSATWMCCWEDVDGAELGLKVVVDPDQLTLPDLPQQSTHQAASTRSDRSS